VFVEITGAGFQNKGAELMLRTVLDKMRAELPGVRFGVHASVGSFEERGAYGLYSVARNQHLRRFRSQVKDQLFLKGLRCLPPGKLNLYGLVQAHQVDALVDISGYAFGDKWPLALAAQFFEVVRDYNRRGKPVVMLPQMLGPFEKNGQAKQFAQIAAQAKLVYARDEISMNCLKAVCNGAKNIRIAPDITIFYEPPHRDEPGAPRREYACIVPNVKMLEQGGSEWQSRYLPLLVESAKRILASGLEVQVFVHETAGKDEELARSILEEVNDPNCVIVAISDPVEIKRHLARARFLVASRFHSIVSAYSSGVPAIVIGWAHKYEALVADFGVPELHCPVEGAESRSGQLIDTLLSQEGREDCHERLVAAKAGMKPANDKMWSEVLEVLASASTGE